MGTVLNGSTVAAGIGGMAGRRTAGSLRAVGEAAESRAEEGAGLRFSSEAKAEPELRTMFDAGAAFAEAGRGPASGGSRRRRRSDEEPEEREAPPVAEPLRNPQAQAAAGNGDGGARLLGSPLAQLAAVLHPAAELSDAGPADNQALLRGERLRELGELLARMAAAAEVSNTEFTVALGHAFFPRSSVKVRGDHQQVDVELQSNDAAESEWFDHHVHQLAAQLADRLQRRVRLRVGSSL